MIPSHRELHPSIHEALGTGRFEGRRGHRHAGLISTSLTPFHSGMYRFKGGGGFMGIFKSIAIGVVLGAIGGGIGGAIFGQAGTGILQGFSAWQAGAIVGAVSGGITGALGGIMGAISAPKTNEADQASYQARDNKMTTRNSTGPRKKIYGTALAGGLMVYATSTGSSHEYFHSVNVLATHQVEAIREQFFNNKPATDSRYSGFYRINKHLGTQTQAADSDLVAEAAGEWTAAHRLRESAYIYPRIKYDQNAWVSGLPGTQAMVDGAIYYDPRLPYLAISTSSAASPGVFSTVGAHGFSPGDAVFIRDHSGATYAAPNGLSKPVTKRYTVNTVPTTTTFTLLNDSGDPMPVLTPGSGGTVAKCQWSNNSALAVLDYITSRDGINCKTSEVDWTYFTSAANVCDEDVSLGTSQTFTVSSTSNALTLSSGVGWQTGKQIFVSSAGTLPAPLASGTAYYWIRSTETTGQLASSYDDAISATAIDITDAGTGTHTAALSTSVSLSASADTVTLPNLSTYIETGDCVTLTGTLAGTDYYWINTDYLSGKLATSRANAMAGVAIDIATDETVQITRKSQARYTTNGIVDLSKKPIDILNELLTACGGVMVYTQGKYRLFPASSASSVKTISESDLRGTIKILPRTARQSLTNAVRGTYKEPANYWEMTDFPPLTSATYEQEDGGQRLYRDIVLPHTIDSQRAQRIASIALGRARRGMVVNFPATVKMLGISAWDCVTLNLNVGDNSILAGKKFRVTYWSLAENGGGIDLTLNEEDDAIYTWSPASGSVTPQNDLSALPSPWIVAPPTGLSVQSGTDQLFVAGDGTVHTRALLTWTAPADTYVQNNGWIDVQYKKHSDTTWTSASPVIGSQTFTYITDVEDAAAYDFRIRSRNTLGAVSDKDGSTWSATVSNYTVVGKSAPPSDVASLSVTQNGNVAVYAWPQIPDADLAGYVLGYGPVGGLPENAAIVTSTTRGTSVTTASVPPGTHVCYVWAKDTSGNLSVNPAYTTVTITNSNTVVAGSEQAPDYLGTSAGFFHHWTGKLVPVGTKAWDQYATWGALPTFGVDSVSVATYDAPEIDLGIDGAERIWAQVQASLLAGSTGNPVPDLYADWRTAAGSYSGFRAVTVANISARYVRFRLQWDSSKGPCAVTSFKPQIDAAQTTQTGTYTIATGGTAITFPSPFHLTPNIQLTPQSGALIASYSGASATGCTVHVYNTSGSDVGGTVNAQFTGP